MKTGHIHINQMIALYESESEPFRKVHRLIDLLETIIKTHTVVLVSNFLHRKALSDDIKSLIAGCLRTPSLGHWHEFSRVIADDLLFNFLTEQQYEHLMQAALSADQKQGLADIYEKHEQYYVIRKGTARKKLHGFLKTLMVKQIKEGHPLFLNPYIVPSFLDTFIEWENTVQAVIGTRNQYAHGATPNDEECLKDIAKLEQILTSWLEEQWLHETKIAAADAEGNAIFGAEANPMDMTLIPYHPYIATKEGGAYSLFPLLYTKQKQDEPEYHLIFFNDLKKYHESKISYLNYPYAEHIHTDSIYHDFLSVIDYDNWKRFKSSIFNERIQELTSNFHGRKEELEELYAYIENHNNGFYYVTGIAGIGKSALLAAASVRLSKEESLYCIPYFVRSGTRLADYSCFVHQLNAQIEEIFHTKINAGPTLGEQVQLLQTRLLFVSASLAKQQKKCVIIIDGIDEFEEIHLHNNLGDLLFAETIANIIFVYGARQSIASQSFYYALEITKRKLLKLEGLNKAYLRSMLYGTINKYELSREDPLIDRIMDKSEGNPLYIKLFCLTLEEKPWDEQTVEQLPKKKIEEFYEGIVSQLSLEAKELPLVDSLILIASLKDVVSPEMLHPMLEISYESAQQCIRRLSAYLVESDEYAGHFQLFHDSFRTYMKATYSNRCLEMQLRIIAVCKQWHNFTRYEGPLATYAFRYAHLHLYELTDAETLKAFIQDKSFSNEQIDKVSIKYSLEMIRTYLLMDEAAALDMAFHVLALHERVEGKIEDILASLPLSERVLADTVNGLSVASRIQVYMEAIRRALASPEEASELIIALDRQIPRGTEVNLLDFYDLADLSQFVFALEESGADSGPLLSRILVPEPQCAAMMEQTTVWTVSARKQFAALLRNLRYDGARYEYLCDIIADLLMQGCTETAKLAYSFAMNAKPSVPVITAFLRGIMELLHERQVEGSLIKNLLDEAFYWADRLPNMYLSQDKSHVFFVGTSSGSVSYEIARPYYLNRIAQLAYGRQYFSLCRAASSRAHEEIRKVPNHFLRILKYRLSRDLIAPPDLSLEDNVEEEVFLQTPSATGKAVALLNYQDINDDTLEAFQAKARGGMDDLSKLPAFADSLAPYLDIQSDIVPNEKIEMAEAVPVTEKEAREQVSALSSQSKDPISQISQYGYQLFLQGNIELGLSVIRNSTKVLKVFQYRESYDDSRLNTAELHALEMRMKYLYKIVQYFIQSGDLERARALAVRLSLSDYKAAAIYLVAKAYLIQFEVSAAQKLIAALRGNKFNRSGSTLRFALADQLESEMVLAYFQQGDLGASLRYATACNQPQEAIAKIQFEMLKEGETTVTRHIENARLRQGIFYAYGQHIVNRFTYEQWMEKVRAFSGKSEFRFLLFGVWETIEPAARLAFLQALEPLLAYHADHRKFYMRIVAEMPDTMLIKQILKAVMGDKMLLQYTLAIFAHLEDGERGGTEQIGMLISSIKPAQQSRYDQFEQWIASIDDEDDKEYLLLLKRQVEKQKLSREEFEQIAARY
ncbi:ATP-binding protein [Paenibacillus sp. NEAU-GSW1]|uniref:nSTAND1 domain-containing NTPase n=1 Tax=Paenibacillus sp. NEAU-GSW1 TaxID=2682486 RepID=UPI001567AEB6|nr:ATP-binding protein [Paenibacillus sp. NEAU-GSW1]